MLLKIVTYKKYIQEFHKIQTGTKSNHISESCLWIEPTAGLYCKDFDQDSKNIDRGGGGPSDLFFLTNKTKVPSPEECSVVWY